MRFIKITTAQTCQTLHYYMKAIKYILLILVLTSCQKKEPIPTDNPTEQYVWPTDAWTTKDPSKLNVNTLLLDSIDTKINNGDYGNVHSLLIVKDGYLIFENYYNGASSYAPHELQSATKSIASIICGIAIDKNYFSDNSTLLNHIDPNYSHNNDSLRNLITIKNLLDMRLGIDWKEWGYPASQKDNIIMANSPDWIQYILNKPMATSPNETFVYNTGASCFISALIDYETPYTTEGFSDEFLFTPIGITSQDWWVQDSKGIVHTGGGLKLTAQDMARFGFLILKEGDCDGNQIISQNYLSKLTNPASLSVISIPVNSIPQPLHYGYHFWNIPMTVNGIDYNIIAVMGTGGQVIFIIKKLDLVVVSTAWNLTEPNQTSSPMEWLKNYIIPSAQ